MVCLLRGIPQKTTLRLIIVIHMINKHKMLAISGIIIGLIGLGMMQTNSTALLSMILFIVGLASVLKAARDKNKSKL